MVRMLNRFIEENVLTLACILDKLEQWYIHYHIFMGTLFYFIKLSKTNWALAHKTILTLLRPKNNFKWQIIGSF